MSTIRRMELADLVAFALIVAAAAGVRVWYLSVAADNAATSGPLRVQDPRQAAPPDIQPRGRAAGNELDELVANLTKDNRFAARTPFALEEEETAHVAPGYPYCLSVLERLTGNADKTDRLVRWIQAGLGAVTAGLYYVVALVGFRSRIVAVLAGLFCIVHPFWIVSTAAVDDGVLATFLLALSLFFGTRGAIAGGPLTSLLYGLSLAALALVRAALLPFAFIALLWFLIRCRAVPRGWLCAVLSVLGFVNGLAPWTVRNWQRFQEPVPIASSVYLHVWIGNNPNATGGPLLDEMVKTLDWGEDPARPSKQLAAAARERDRSAVLAREALKVIQRDPAGTIHRRVWAVLSFFFGEEFLDHDWGWVERNLQTQAGGLEALPGRLGDHVATFVLGATLFVLLLGVLGWRWTFAWRRESRLLALAAVCIPLPYVFAHAEGLIGPRLPLDGVLITFAAFALACFVPGLGASLFAGPERGGNEVAANRRLHEDKLHDRV
jgi:4-amino-4-deoxy-L-arabinose transferase-like glycosyltransferase